MVCIDYLSPSYIDPKFFKAEYVFKESETDFQDQAKNLEINSISKIFEKNKRKTISDNTPLTMYREITLKEFIKSNNPYAIFYEYNEIKIKD